MKLSKPELAAVALAAGGVLFFAGWFFRGNAPRSGTYAISTRHYDAGDTPTPTQTFFVPDKLVDLNTATQAELESLPGIGAVRAAAILAYREEHGPFTRPEQLTQVEGIGQSTYDELAPYITVIPVEGGDLP